MGLFQFITSFLLRKQILSNLCANCPEGVKTQMATLLANKKAADLIRQFMMTAMKSRTKLQADAVTNLPFPDSIRKLLADNPKLVTYLLLAARMAGKK